jgi:hypothetical protein
MYGRRVNSDIFLLAVMTKPDAVFSTVIIKIHPNKDFLTIKISAIDTAKALIQFHTLGVF